MKNTRKRKLHEVSGEPLPERQVVTKRRKLDRHALIDFFEKQIEEKAKDRRTKTKVKAKDDRIQFRFSGNDEKFSHVSPSLGLKVRRRFTVEEQTLVIFLRFGSLNSDARVWMTYSDIWKKTGVKIQSQLAIIN